MKAYAGGIRFLTLKVKFIILFMVLISVPFFICGLLVYNKFAANIETNTRNATEQLMEQLGNNLDRFSNEVERLTLAPVSNTEVLRVLDNHSMIKRNTVYLATDEQKQMITFIASTVFHSPEISSIMIFTNNGHLFSSSESVVKNFWIEGNEKWMERVDEADGALMIIPSHIVSYYALEPREVVSFARLIREPFTHRKLGIIKIDLEPTNFDKIFSSIQLGNGGRLYIFDSYNQRVYPGREHVANPDLNDPGMLTAYGQAKSAGLNIVAQIPYSELNKDAHELTRYTLAISLLSLGFAFILAILSANRLIKPIRHLQSKMKLIQKGAFQERAAITTHDEIGQLTEVFNRMMDEIDRLVHEVYETKLREREAELAALQSQMNPHFLYNSLETINMLAVRAGQWEMAEFVSNLGKLLRYTVDRKQTVVTLMDEILFIEAYLQVQSIRNENKIHVQIEVDPSLGPAIVPKLMLQPLIENALVHGMDELPLIIRLQAKLMDDDLLVTVDDDGIGIQAANVRIVEEKMLHGKEDEQPVTGFAQPTRGHGLRNVHQRIRLLYGDPYGVTIRCKAGRGVAIIIRLPFRWEE